MREDDHADEALAVCYCVPELVTAPTKDFIRGLTTTTARLVPDAVLIVGYVPSGAIPVDDRMRFFPGLITAAKTVAASHSNRPPAVRR